MEWLLIAFPVVVGLAFGQTMRFHSAVAELASNLATADRNKLGSTMNYQNSITPPWLVHANASLFTAAIASMIASAYAGGWSQLLLSVAILALSVLASLVVSSALSIPTFPTYVRMTFNTLSNREADYLKQGDVARADAAKHFSFLITTVAGHVL